MLPEERGPVEASPGWSAETDRVRKGISEGFYLVEFGWVVLRSAEVVSLWLLYIREFESTGSLADCGKTIVARWKFNGPHI